MTCSQMVGMVEMGRSELTNTLSAVFAGFDDGLDERRGVRRMKVASEVFILDPCMVDGAIDQTGEEGKRTSFMECYGLNCMVSRFIC